MRDLMYGLTGWAYGRSTNGLLLHAIDIAITIVGAALLVSGLLIFTTR